MRIVPATMCLAAAIVAASEPPAEAGSLVIPAWSFARGNVQIHADPSQYADCVPVVGSGGELDGVSCNLKVE